MFSPYKLTELKVGLYQFTTDQEVVYHVYFGDGMCYFQDYPEFSDDVMTFGFDKISAPRSKSRADIKIRFTITHHILNLFNERQDKILFFVCDSADSRGTARMRMFEHWYQQQKISFLEKYNESITTSEIDIHCSIILHSRNMMKDHIISCFRNLSKSTAEKLKSY